MRKFHHHHIIKLHNRLYNIKRQSHFGYHSHGFMEPEGTYLHCRGEVGGWEYLNEPFFFFSKKVSRK